MEERLRKLEVALLHTGLLLMLHERAIEGDPLAQQRVSDLEDYSMSFKLGQRLIINDVKPSLEEAKLEFNLLKEELLNECSSGFNR